MMTALLTSGARPALARLATVPLRPHRHAALFPLAHPDAELLDVCAELGRQQDEWQRLWKATPDEGSDTPADKAWEEYNSNVWPGTALKEGEGLAGRLAKLRARTLEGLAAKAAAVCAMEDTSLYTGCFRSDSCELSMSVLRDAAGAAYRPLGEDAEDA